MHNRGVDLVGWTQQCISCVMVRVYYFGNSNVIEFVTLLQECTTHYVQSIVSLYGAVPNQLFMNLSNNMSKYELEDQIPANI